MSDEKKPEEALPEPLNIELEMYKDYLRYMSVEDIGVKYNMSTEGVYKIAKRNNWKEKRQKAKEQAYKNLDKQYRSQIVDIVHFIQHDYTMLMQKCIKEKREMTKEERQYILKLLENLTKESRLTEGKPTEITENGGVVEHRVILPPGVKRFGVIPPAANVIQVEAKEVKPEESKPEDSIELDDDET